MVSELVKWWAIKDLNLGPLPCEGSALTTELIARPLWEQRCLRAKGARERPLL
jgi:hypothetical protein